MQNPRERLLDDPVYQQQRRNEQQLNQQEQELHEDTIKNRKRGIINLLWITYIGACLYFESDKLKNSENYCTVTSRNFVINFLIFVVIPGCVFSNFIQTPCISQSQLLIQVGLKLTSAYRHISLAIYLWLAMIYLVDMTFLEECPYEQSISRINYALIVLIHLQDGALYIMLISVLIFCMPCIIYKCIVHIRSERRNQQIRAEVALKIFSLPYDKLREQEKRGVLPSIDQAECVICMEGFIDVEGKVEEATPLACHFTHVFHKECLQSWLQRNNSCPNCKEAITQQTIEKVKKLFQL